MQANCDDFTNFEIDINQRSANINETWFQNYEPIVAP